MVGKQTKIEKGKLEQENLPKDKVLLSKKMKKRHKRERNKECNKKRYKEQSNKQNNKRYNEQNIEPNIEPNNEQINVQNNKQFNERNKERNNEWNKELNKELKELNTDLNKELKERNNNSTKELNKELNKDLKKLQVQNNDLNKRRIKLNKINLLEKLKEGKVAFVKSYKKLFVCIHKFKDNMKNILPPFVFFFISILYLEIVLHGFIYKSLDSKIIFPVLFASTIGALIALIAGFFDSKVNIIIMWLVTGALCLLFCVQLVYFYVFKVYFSFQSLSMAGDAISEFNSLIVSAIGSNLFGIILLVLPLPALYLFIQKYYDCRKRTLKQQGTLFAQMSLLHILTLIVLFGFGTGDYTPYDLYHNVKVADMCGKQLGIITLTRFDVVNLFQGDKLVLASTPAIHWYETEESEQLIVDITPTPSVVPSKREKSKITQAPTPSVQILPTPTPMDNSPNVMNIDFVALAESEKDKTIKTLHNYFASVEPTNKNEFTGFFQGYNLIMITAEGFSPYAVHKEKTPTLYKLINEGFIFSNFYTALWQTSTSDGEYVACTGLIPIGTRSMFHTRNNYMPFTLGHQFNKLGVESKAYHNHTHTYYQRNETHPNMGYIFKAKGNGLVLDNPDFWPASDLEMINATVDEYINEDQFHVYYLTVSGHMNYTFAGNRMSNKNKEKVKDLSYSSDARAYIACQMELDKALELLIKRLEQAGVGDKTVIALSSDHYPYGWEKENLDELAGYKIDPNFEVYKNHFILWNPRMKETIVVDKPSSSLDILPTLSNLFGLEYDSRLLMGRDIFSDSDPLVIFSNGSFITDKVMYNSATREVIRLTEEELPEDYISIRNKIIKNKFSISQSIVKKDYYRSIFPNEN